MAPSPIGGKEAAVKPLLAATATEAPDEQLVAAARDGSDEAFEALFRRYQDRVVGYVRGMVSDHGRAEDIVQEAFMSALRSLRRSDQEIVFRPWIYEIAKNACIDHLRRARRAQEVSIDSDDFNPVEESRISQAATGTDAAVARRNQLESLRMAFHDLPPTQHEILVMRELEGLSYDSIGDRMGLTRGAVESLLFRARRRLRNGFDEIDTGARCQTMQDLRWRASRTAALEHATAAASPTTCTNASHAVATRSPWASTRWCWASSRAARAGPPAAWRPSCRCRRSCAAGWRRPRAASGPPRRPGWSRAPRLPRKATACSSPRSSPQAAPAWPTRLPVASCRAGTSPWSATRAAASGGAAETRRRLSAVAAQAARGAGGGGICPAPGRPRRHGRRRRPGRSRTDPRAAAPAPSPAAWAGRSTQPRQVRVPDRPPARPAAWGRPSQAWAGWDARSSRVGGARGRVADRDDRKVDARTTSRE